MVDYSSTYNVILGRPTLNRLKATTTQCLKVKFPTPHRIGEISGDQLLARECYHTVLASKENHAWMVEKESKLVEKTFNVELVKGDSSKVINIGGELKSPLKEEIINFLKGNLDVFAWSHGDVHNIDRRVFAPA